MEQHLPAWQQQMPIRIILTLPAFLRPARTSNKVVFPDPEGPICSKYAWTHICWLWHHTKKSEVSVSIRNQWQRKSLTGLPHHLMGLNQRIWMFKHARRWPTAHSPGRPSAGLQRSRIHFAAGGPWFSCLRHGAHCSSAPERVWSKGAPGCTCMQCFVSGEWLPILIVKSIK